ncbi:MAG: VWA domain-containing protein [Pseudomonadota bacterium]|nr:VWA domain-containing protein [Pseudomonadota bacterium]
MLRALLTTLLFLTLPFMATAQERPSAILVLDASGSMWGQIEGVNKIVIAREVVGDLLGTLPEDQALGLVAYGHRAKGDCGDIELLYQPGTDRQAIADAVNGLNPKGKTPLSAAVLQAAEALKYTEEAATVILVSDGIETCDVDPCALGRQLEETGVGFTAHVIGFDVTEPEAQAQLQCLAEETGGMYRSASNASELSGALEEVAIVAPEPEPEPVEVQVTFRATNGEGGPVIPEGLVWTVNAGDAVLTDKVEEASPMHVIEEDTTGTVEVLRLSDEVTGTASFTVGASDMIVTVALPEYVEPLPQATVEAPASAPAGSLVPVTFTGPEAEGDYVASASDGKEDGYYDAYEYTNKAEDGVVMVRMPPVAGPAELRYILGRGGDVLARTSIEVTPIDVQLTAPVGAAVGTTPDIAWVGPDYRGDYINVSSLDQGDGYYETYAYTKDGNPLAIQMPTEPGTYELRYILSASRHVAGRSEPFEVSETSVTLEAPGEAVAGSNIDVTWTGPGARGDYIGIGRVGRDERPYLTYSYTNDGNPLEIETPIEPGDYEIRYFLGQDQTMLHAVPISLTEVTASITAPATAQGGVQLPIEWTGPDYQSDYISVAKAGSGDGEYVTYTYTREGSPLDLQMPTEGGDYEIRYVASQNTEVLSRASITVEASTATISGPESAPAGSLIDVTWDGPDTASDYIAIAETGSEAGDYLIYEYTRRGNPVEIEVPTIPGTYEIQYIQSGRPNRILATAPVTSTEVSATVSGVLAGDKIEVTWEGPDDRGDFIVIATPGSGPNEYEDYAYTDRGNPALLDVPEAAGSYELRYILDGTTDRVLASVPFIVP